MKEPDPSWPLSPSPCAAPPSYSPPPPYILGFNRTDSLVVIALTDGRVGLTTRGRHARPRPDPPARQAILPALTTERPEQVIVVAYEDDRTLSSGTLETLTDAVTEAGIGIKDRRLVEPASGASSAATGRAAAHPIGATTEN